MEIWKMGYDKGFLIKSDLKNAILKKELSAADYKAITGEVYEPNLDAIKRNKSGELKATCKSVIESGFKSSVKNGQQSYNLRLEDQSNMAILMDEIKNGATRIPWHNANQTICEVWTAEEFTQLFLESKDYILKQRFYCDGLEEMLAQAATLEEVEAIRWGIELPTEIQSQINAVIQELQA